MLSIVSSYELGSPIEPGEYLAGGVSYLVERAHVRTWQDHPQAQFRTILRTRLGDETLRLVLGSLVDDPS